MRKVDDVTLTGAIARVVEDRRAETVRLLQELVRAPSVTGSEGAVQEIVEGAFRGLGLATERIEATEEQISSYREHVGEPVGLADRPSVVGVRTGRGGGGSLLLNAHVDTVGNGDPSAWTQDPLSGEVEGDLLYGRGSCDMKGGLATYLAALGALDDLGIELRGDVTVAATVGEETGGVGALATILAGYRADAALITEPTRLALVPAQAGGVVFRITVPGIAVQCAKPHEGISAFEKFLPIFEGLTKLEKERNATLSHPLFDHLPNKAPINVGVVRAGEWAVTVPGSLVAECRIGLLPGEELGPVRSLVLERVADAAGRDPWLRENPPGVEFFLGQSEPAEVPPDAPICGAVARAHERVTGRKPDVEGVTYGSDMRLFTRFGRMPCVMYGAGDIGWGHRADEHIGIAELLTATKTVACLLVDWCGAASLPGGLERALGHERGHVSGGLAVERVEPSHRPPQGGDVEPGPRL